MAVVEEGRDCSHVGVSSHRIGLTEGARSGSHGWVRDLINAIVKRANWGLDGRRGSLA